jgi:hypothetical protein
MDFRSTRCIFLGYSLNHKSYKCLDPTTNRIYIARNVVFDENAFPYPTSSKSHAPPSVPPSHIQLPYLTNSNHITHPLPLTSTNSSTTFPSLSPYKYLHLFPQKSAPQSLQHPLPRFCFIKFPKISSPFSTNISSNNISTTSYNRLCFTKISYSLILLIYSSK